MEEQAGADVCGVCISKGIAIAPGDVRLHTFDDVSSPNIGNPIIWAKHPGVVIGIHYPAELQLFQIAHAIDALGVCLRSAQGREEKRREDGNDGDDDEQLHQSECAPGNKWPPHVSRRDSTGFVQSIVHGLG
jgi:hypothetical protein